MQITARVLADPAEPRPAAIPPEEFALTTLVKMPYAVAFLDETKGNIFKNEAFEALFGEGDLPAKLLRMLSSAHDVAQTTCSILDGRCVSLSIKAVPGGRVLCAHELAKVSPERAPMDSLTGLVTKANFNSHLKTFADDGDQAVAVLSIDLDRFKAINDTLGHPVGDALLQAVAGRLVSAASGNDIVARLGGDEFGVLQVGQPQPDASHALAKRLVDLLSRTYIVDGHQLNIGASVGVALLPSDGRTEAELIRRSDLALYHAKEQGRKTYRFYEPAMLDRMQARRELELDLRRALAMRELALVYQPQVNLKSRQITGFEALLRWHCPKRGLVSPAQFIPLAEEIGCIVQIGEWVMRTACKEAIKWPNYVCVAVNVSAIQFDSPNLLPTVISALAESGLDPRRLELEITESVLLRDQTAALKVLHAIRSLGVRISMDDFGTGYSSLSYLHSFPFNKIKIDQSFIRGGDKDDPSRKAIVSAIAALGRALGMATTAEGVETEQQLKQVAADGCTDIQGYLISKPVGPDSVQSLLTNSERKIAEFCMQGGNDGH